MVNLFIGIRPGTDNRFFSYFKLITIPELNQSVMYAFFCIPLSIAQLISLYQYSLDGIYRVPQGDLPFPKIPVQPISWSDATPLLK
jgi:hypothetical protein